MNIERLQELKAQQMIKAVNFIEAGHSPLVIEIEYVDQGQCLRALLTDDEGVVISYNHLKEGYDVCLKAGIRKANLVQTETDDEVCQSAYARYHRESIPLVF